MADECGAPFYYMFLVCVGWFGAAIRARVANPGSDHQGARRSSFHAHPVTSKKLQGMLSATTRRMRGPRQNPMPQMCLVPAGAFGTRRRPIGKWVIPAAEDSSPWRLFEESGGASWGAARGSRRSIFTATSANHSAIYNKVRTTETELNMKDLIQFGKDANRATLLTSAQWLQNDLPIRLSHRIKELQSLPAPMFNTKPVIDLCNLYEESFVRIVDHDSPTQPQIEGSFSDMLKDIKEKHRMVQANIADGFREMVRNGVPQRFMEHAEIQEKLARFYTGRIGLRLLIDQHLMLRHDLEQKELKDKEGDKDGEASKDGVARQSHWVGVVQTGCLVHDVILDAAEDARAACRLHLRDAPNVYVDGMKELRCPYIPEHLYTILLELLKNSMRATVELHGRNSNSHEPLFGETLPPTRITISGGSDVVIRISDRGGGIPPESFCRIWNFSFSTAPQGMGELAGFGHGLPLSRRYARYWGGDMEVFNMENLGLDVYVRLGVPDNAAKYKAPEWKKRDSNAGNTSNDPQLRR